MLHILLMILKITGFVLLGLVGLVLLILLLVLNVPIRYKGSAEKDRAGADTDNASGTEDVPPGDGRDEETAPDDGRNEKAAFSGSAVISWLLHLVHVRVDYSSGLLIEARVLGIKVYSSGGSDGDAADTDVADEAEPEDSDGAPLDSDSSDAETEGQKAELTCEVPESQRDAAQTGEAQNCAGQGSGTTTGEACSSSTESNVSQTITGPEAADSSDNDSEACEETFSYKLFRALYSIIDAIGGKKKRVEEKLKALEEKLEKLSVKTEQVRDIIEDDRFSRAVGCVFRQLGRLLKSILPRRVRGSAEFGFEDPAVTGYVLAVMGAMYGGVTHNFEITPDFENKTFSGHLRFRGHIRIITIVVIALKVLINKNCRYAYRSIKQLF